MSPSPNSSYRAHMMATHLHQRVCFMSGIGWTTSSWADRLVGTSVLTPNKPPSQSGKNDSVFPPPVTSGWVVHPSNMRFNTTSPIKLARSLRRFTSEVPELGKENASRSPNSFDVAHTVAQSRRRNTMSGMFVHRLRLDNRDTLQHSIALCT
jgi:hypothetical protein